MPDQSRPGAGETEAIEAILLAKAMCLVIGGGEPTMAECTYCCERASTWQDVPHEPGCYYAVAYAELTALRTRLEEAEARERWIPMSERLPEANTRVLGSRTAASGLKIVEGAVMVGNSLIPDQFDWPFEETPKFDAWRELPAPYNTLAAALGAVTEETE